MSRGEQLSTRVETCRFMANDENVTISTKTDTLKKETRQRKAKRETAECRREKLEMKVGYILLISTAQKETVGRQPWRAFLHALFYCMYCYIYNALNYS